MFFAKLDRLRQKPPAARKRVALASAVALTGIVTLVWMVSLPARFSEQTTVVDRSNGSVPFASIGLALQEQWATVRSALPSAPAIGVSPAAEFAPVATTTSDTTMSTSSMFVTVLPLATSTPSVATPPITIMIGTTSATSGQLR